MPTLTKAELVQKIYNSHPSFTKTQAGEIVENFFDLQYTLEIAGIYIKQNVHKIKRQIWSFKYLKKN